MTREERAAYQKAHYAKNREKILARQKAYRDKHREARNAYQRAYSAKNPGKHVAYQKAYRARNPEKFAGYIKAYNLKVRGFTVKEITIEKYLVSKIESRGGFCPKFVDASRRGAPDRLVILPGHPTYYAELKRPKFGRLAPWQKRYHEQLRACGQRVWVLSSIEEVDRFLCSL